MELNLVELISLIAGVIGIVGFVWQVFSKKKENKQKQKDWAANVCKEVSDISQIMGIGNLDQVLNKIYLHVNGKTGLDGDLKDRISSNEKVFDNTRAGIQVLLNSGPVSKSIKDSFRIQLDDILNQYNISKNDLAAIVDLCEARDYADVNAILDDREIPVSDELRGAIASAGSAHDNSSPFDLASFISDVIGIRFVDSQIPDYSEMASQLISQLQEKVSSDSVGLSIDKNSRHYRRHGSPDALCEKAGEYYASKNYKKAFDWYMKAAAQKNDFAFYRLGECFEKGEGCSKDLKKAADYYQNAAELGLPIAEYRIGRCFEEGIGRDRDPSQAFLYYKRSADDGYDKALYKVGLCFWKGWPDMVDKQEARFLIEKAAEKGCVDALRGLSTICYLEGNFEESVKWAKAAADNKDVDGMGYYGYLLMINGAEKSEYLPLLTQSALGGNVYSQFNMGILSLDEENLGMFCSDFDEKYPDIGLPSAAQQWFKMAAELGDPASQFILGMYNLQKNGDRNIAESWFEKAIGNGFKWAHFGLGFIHYHMVHGTEAREHLEYAWEEGNPFVGKYLWQMYLSGYGIEKDTEKASFYQNSAVNLACEWFLSKTDKQLSALKQSYVPPFDRQFYDDPDSDSTCQKVIDSTLMEYIRRY